MQLPAAQDRMETHSERGCLAAVHRHHEQLAFSSGCLDVDVRNDRLQRLTLAGPREKRILLVLEFRDQWARVPRQGGAAGDGVSDATAPVAGSLRLAGVEPASPGSEAGVSSADIC